MVDLGPVQRGEVLKLGLGNLYILPSRFGMLWLAGIGLLQVVAIQLESNGPLLLSFLMLGLFLLTLHLTHFNLQGLEVRCGRPVAGFVGTPLAYPLRLRCRGRCEALRLRLGPEELDQARSLGPGDHLLTLPWVAAERGRCRPGRLALHTTAPLGLFVCWSRWEPPVPQLVIPAPRRGPVGLVPAAATPERGEPGASLLVGEGGDTWHDLRPHRPEDGRARLAWKLLAQGRGAHAKRFVESLPGSCLLRPADGVPLERALEHLCAAILQLHGNGVAYGLVLAEVTIPPGQGPQQRDRCLEALALCPRGA
jgi:uncharacterized protein (DUF58 family)